MIGERLGKYELRGLLGRGGMGAVYEAWDPAIERQVAIKTVALTEAADAETEEALARFKREAQAAGRLQHPNIVGIHDYGETAELAYIVMEFVAGRSLKSVLDAGERFDLPAVARLMDALLAGLAYSHARGVVHRDIKPANLLLTAGGELKIADFGIARIESSSMTQAGTVLGTPAYMSPEQLMGESVDARSDLYAAGVVLYQLLTGERPFQGSTTSIMHKALHTEPPPPSALAVTAPPALDAVVARAMAKRPEARFADAASFATALHAALAAPAPMLVEEPTIIVKPTQSAPTSGMVPPRRGAAPALLAAFVLLLALAGAGAWWWWQANKRQPPVVSIAPVATVQPVAKPSPAIATTPPGPPPTPHIALASPSKPPPPPPTPAPTPAPIDPRAAITAALAPLGCALVEARQLRADGPITLSGAVGAGAPEAALRAAVLRAAPAVPLAWHLESFDGPYCTALDVLRPIAGSDPIAGGGLGLALPGQGSVLRDHALITIHVSLPDFPAWLQVDYLQHDGSVFHLHPTARDPARRYAAGGGLTLGDPQTGGARWEVGPPFGTDMIIATASAAPLFATPRAELEPAGPYLDALRAAIAAARRRGERLAGAALVLTTAAAR